MYYFKYFKERKHAASYNCKSQILRYSIISEMFKCEKNIHLRIDGIWYVLELFQFYREFLILFYGYIEFHFIMHIRAFIKPLLILIWSVFHSLAIKNNAVLNNLLHMLFHMYKVHWGWLFKVNCWVRGIFVIPIEVIRIYNPSIVWEDLFIISLTEWVTKLGFLPVWQVENYSLNVVFICISLKSMSSVSENWP